MVNQIILFSYTKHCFKKCSLKDFWKISTLWFLVHKNFIYTKCSNFSYTEVHHSLNFHYFIFTRFVIPLPDLCLFLYANYTLKSLFETISFIHIIRKGLRRKTHSFPASFDSHSSFCFSSTL